MMLPIIFFYFGSVRFKGKEVGFSAAEISSREGIFL